MFLAFGLAAVAVAIAWAGARAVDHVVGAAISAGHASVLHFAGRIHEAIVVAEAGAGGAKRAAEALILA